MTINPFHPELFNNKTVVLTGAGNGIGLSVLEMFIASGANVVAHLGRSHEYTNNVPSKVHHFVGDLLDRKQQDAFCSFVQSHTDSIDVLVNNAGTMFGRFPADTISDDEYLNIVELNQSAVVRITRALIPLLKCSDNGSIINTVSISASTGGSPGSSIYSASKAFVATYTKALARELAPSGIRANAVSPGVIETDFHQRYSTQEKLDKTRTLVPLQRLGTPSDCAPAYVFLGSHQLSGYITGQTLEINGGLF